MARGKRFGAADGFTLQEYEKMVSESGGVCFYCGGKGKLETDHKIPLCRGGSNHISNICLACVSCNRRKARMTADEFWSSGKMGATDDAVPALNESG
jgi:5-methylcytosine-specific restriction endonuclease McrA